MAGGEEERKEPAVEVPVTDAHTEVGGDVTAETSEIPEAKCKIAKNVVLRGQKCKVVDPSDSCAALNRVLAKHEGAKVITPKEYDALLKASSQQ